ncbi:hypothetical protein F3Y22_tig00002119pilonHSYRG00001 [Hibiscus syriacus]|uniref:MACPF domain-containing protein n=1 Tax=Hibiscus syriacus TaxID=106335 RepID=A0A6A3CV82_HIBSY|nr:hypothetical protein F3Y22_tig00002119pilonHSYRG00001 [Hibiscus syriacus]
MKKWGKWKCSCSAHYNQRIQALGSGFDVNFDTRLLYCKGVAGYRIIESRNTLGMSTWTINLFCTIFPEISRTPRSLLAVIVLGVNCWPRVVNSFLHVGVARKVKQAVPISWDPLSLGSFIETLGTHVITSVTMVGVVPRLFNSQGIYPQPSNAHILMGKRYLDGLLFTVRSDNAATHAVELSFILVVVIVIVPTDVTIIFRRRGGDDLEQNHTQWVKTVRSSPDVIEMTFYPITALLDGVAGKEHLARAMSLYLESALISAALFAAFFSSYRRYPSDFDPLATSPPPQHGSRRPQGSPPRTPTRAPETSAFPPSFGLSSFTITLPDQHYMTVQSFITNDPDVYSMPSACSDEIEGPPTKRSILLMKGINGTEPIRYHPRSCYKDISIFMVMTHGVLIASITVGFKCRRAISMNTPNIIAFWLLGQYFKISLNDFNFSMGFVTNVMDHEYLKSLHDIPHDFDTDMAYEALTGLAYIQFDARITKAWHIHDPTLCYIHWFLAYNYSGRNDTTSF